MTPPVTVTVSALDAGHITLPERLFVTDADPEKRATVPSLSFLIQHQPEGLEVIHSKLIFDLGVKRDLKAYTKAQQDHIAQRQPVITSPDCAESLRKGGLDPKDITYIILSHVHWDHIGTPSDFPNSSFIVGAGTQDLLKNGGGPLYPAELFNDDELPYDMTWELEPVPDAEKQYPSDGGNAHVARSLKWAYVPEETMVRLPDASVHPENWTWKPLSTFPNTLDFFGDGSLYVIDSPGHLFGHLNLLARIGERKYVYLGGDCCHDPRILSGEKDIAMYEDGMGGMRSVHVDTGVARKTLDRIQGFIRDKKLNGEEIEVEVIVAHDAAWREENIGKGRFWPGKL